MNDNQILKNFSTLINCIRTAMEFDSFNDVFNEYNQLINIISGWSENYKLNKNFNSITYEESLQLHKLIDDIREKKLFDRNIGDEKEISDQIFIYYEVLIKSINDEINALSENKKG